MKRNDGNADRFGLFLSENGTVASLAEAVRRQLGCEDSDGFFAVMRDVCDSPCGTDAGFPGFTWHSDTVGFFMRNRADIVRLAEEMADDIGEGSAVGMVRKFRGMEEFSQDEIGRALYDGSVSPDDVEDCVCDVMAKLALSEVANAAVDWMAENADVGRRPAKADDK